MNILGVILKFRLQLLALIILLAALAAAGFFYQQYQTTQKELKELQKDPRAAAREEAKKLVEKVGKLVDLPAGEDPTVATVTDAEKLKNQPFFAKAKNGDKVLIYTQAKKAFLYDPSANKVLEIAPINIGEQATQQAPIRVVLRNGTTTTGLTNKIEPEIKKALNNAEIVKKENAAKTDYEKTIVVTINSGSRAQGEQLARSLGAEVSDLPEGESRPEADLLVIVGKDKE